MHTLIVYASRHGTTAASSERLAALVGGDVTVKQLKRHNRRIDLAPYDRILIGGSIHAGHIQGRVRKFCEKYEAQLLTKPLGLFLCCMEEGETAQQQFDHAFPENLRKHALACGFFGGEFRIERMNFVERYIIKKVVKVEDSISKMNEAAIREFAATLSAH